MIDGRRPLRVAMIGQYGIPAAYGGVERVVEELGAELVAHQVEVDVYCSRRGATAIKHYRGMRLRTVPEIRGKHLGKLSLSGFAAFDALFRDYDVIHFHAMGPCLFAPLIRIFRPSVTVCSTIHSRDDLFAKWTGLAKRLFRIAAWCAARVPPRVMVVSEDLRHQITRDFGVDATVVRNGFALVPEQGGVNEIARWGLEAGRYLLSVGRLVQEKATDDLIAAFCKFDGDWKLAVVGEAAHTGDYAESVHQMAANDKRIVLAGPVFGAPLDALYRSAGAFVLPSRLEGMPIVLLEAIGYGLPVIASDIPANLEVLRSNGPGRRIFPVGDREALAREIKLVVSAQAAESAAARETRRRVLDQFSWSHAANVTIDVYEAARKRRN